MEKLIAAAYMWLEEHEKWVVYIEDAEIRMVKTNDRGLAEMYLYLIHTYEENRDNAWREYTHYTTLLEGNRVPRWNPNAL